MEWREGIHAGVPFEEYAALEGINISTLCWADCSAAHLKAALDGKLQHDSADMVYGRALHCRLLEPDEYYRRFVVAGQCEAIIASGAKKGQPCGNDGKVVADGKWLCGVHASKTVREWSAEVSETEILTRDQAARIELSAQFMAADPTVRLLRQRGGCEVTLCFTIKGVKAKARLDKLIPRQSELPPIVLDLKKCQVGSITRRGIERRVLDYCYDAQAAWYVDAVKVLTGDEPRFVWVFVEDDYPFCIKPLLASKETIEVGRLRYKRFLGTYLCGVETGKWPGPQEGTVIEEGGLPQWFVREWIGA